MLILCIIDCVRIKESDTKRERAGKKVPDKKHDQLAQNENQSKELMEKFQTFHETSREWNE